MNNKAVTQADLDAAREFMADVHNRHQWVSAVNQLRPEVIAEMSARNILPSIDQSAA